MSNLTRVKDDIERYLNKEICTVLNGDTIEVKEKNKQAELKKVKVRIDDNFKTDVIISFNTNPKQFLKIMKNQKNCDCNFVVERIDGKTFCLLIELKTTIYDDDLLYDDGAKSQIKSTFIYVYMLLKFLDLNPIFRAVVFYKNDKRSRTLPSTDIDPYLQRETDIEEECWDFELPNDRVQVKFELIQADNDQEFNLNSLATF
jgi:hypothetical protein